MHALYFDSDLVSWELLLALFYCHMYSYVVALLISCYLFMCLDNGLGE